MRKYLYLTRKKIYYCSGCRFFWQDSIGTGIDYVSLNHRDKYTVQKKNCKSCEEFRLRHFPEGGKKK